MPLMLGIQGSNAKQFVEFLKPLNFAKINEGIQTLHHLNDVNLYGMNDCILQ